MKVTIVVALCVLAAQATVIDVVSSSNWDYLPLPSPRIVNGSAANVGQFPWQVVLDLALTSGGYSVCGGTLISSEWVLTNAHCTQGVKSFNVGLGSTLYKFPAVNLTTTTRVQHPNFNSATLNNDISLIRLPTNVSFTINIQPIRLPRLSQASVTFVGTNATASGFGLTSASSGISSNLRYMTAPIIDNKDCASLYGAAVVINSTVCTSGVNKRGNCQGDDGGPLVIYENTIPTLLGVTSFVSSRGCAFGDPSGYVRVTHFLNWISSVTKIAIFP